MTHTPTPWVLSDGYETVGALIGEISIRASGDIYTAETVAICKAKENRRVLSENIVANAEFIVRACNNHTQLFEALGLLIDNITPKAWEALPHYVQEQVMQTYNNAKGEE